MRIIENLIWVTDSHSDSALSPCFTVKSKTPGKAQKKTKEETVEMRKAIMYGKHEIDSGEVNKKFSKSSDRIDFMNAAQGEFIYKTSHFLGIDHLITFHRGLNRPGAHRESVMFPFDF